MGAVRGLRGDRLWVWGVRGWWAALPFTAGPVLADALHETSPSWRSTSSLGLWVLWALVLVGILLAHPVTLVLVRLALPSAVAALVWAGLGGAGWDEVALVAAITAAVAAASLSAPVGQVLVNGISYGDEIRLLLRPPAMLVAGPVPAAAAITVGGLLSGPLLLAAEHWVAGVVITVVGGLLAVVGARSLYSLTRRWLVFVPAGVVIHDHLAVQDPLLLRRRVVAVLGPAPQGSDQGSDTVDLSTGAAPQESDTVDLSMGAAGLILELAMTQPITLTPPTRRANRATGDTSTGDIKTTAVLIAPSRPGLATTLARQRLTG
ncbi:hypothetical protein [Candidatus Poriferisocius sp.]|uniref:hypothetical protein n=1 Tax=Candidatus Poriferisocius sp. TaxID=3101276 RepID=UPI003B02DC46